MRSGAIYEPAAEGASSFVDTRDIAAVAVAALTDAAERLAALDKKNGALQGVPLPAEVLLSNSSVDQL